MINVQSIPSGQLLEGFRDTLLALGRVNGEDASLAAKADQFEEEIQRRMAW